MIKVLILSFMLMAPSCAFINIQRGTIPGPETTYTEVILLDAELDNKFLIPIITINKDTIWVPIIVKCYDDGFKY